MERVKDLVPGDLSVRLLLGDLCNLCLRPDQALKIAAEIQADPDLRPLGLANEVEVALLEAKAWFALTHRPVAQGIVYALLATHPGDAFVSERAVATFAACKSYSDALRIIDRQLQLAPNDAAALVNKGNLCILTGDFSNAIPPLTLSLSLTNTYAAPLNRALAYLRRGQLGLPRTFGSGYWPFNLKKACESSGCGIVKLKGPPGTELVWYGTQSTGARLVAFSVTRLRAMSVVPLKVNCPASGPAVKLVRASGGG